MTPPIKRTDLYTIEQFNEWIESNRENISIVDIHTTSASKGSAPISTVYYVENERTKDEEGRQEVSVPTVGDDSDDQR